MSAIREFLARQLAVGDWTLGQVLVAPDLTLRHVADVSHSPPSVFLRPEDAREIAKYDAAGTYRPLKTAPNLRRGWELRLGTVADLHLALDLFYPAALGVWLAGTRGELVPVPLRDTLGRQTGMYRVTQLVRDDQAEALIQQMCVAGCLRRRLWPVSGPPAAFRAEDASPRNLPVLCPEGCNLFVAACRPLAKENLPKAG